MTATIQRLFEHTVTISRLQPSTGSKTAFGNVATAVAAMIQPLDAEEAAAHGMAYDQAYQLWVAAGTDIKQSDKVTDQDGVVYQVSGIKRHNYGRNAHLEAIISRQLEGN